MDDLIETLLQTETRWIPTTSGREQQFTATLLIWKAYEYVLAWGYTPEELVERAIIDGKETGRPFCMSFPHIVSYMERAFRKRFGDTIPQPFQRSKSKS